MTRYIPFLCSVLLLCSCSGGGDSLKGDVLVKVGDATFTAADLREAMPYGLGEEDSVKFARAYIRGWIDRKLVGEIAARNIDDNPAIERMVEEYRNELVMMEYRRRMAQQNAATDFAEDSLRQYYDSHPKDFVLERPLLRGIYIKIDDNAPRLDKIKEWYRSDDIEDIEQLEKYGITGAIHYDYFRDHWIDWEQVDAKIPYDFGPDANAFLRAHKTPETSSDGSTYLLSVSEWIPSGQRMPFEYAASGIREIFANRRRLEYDAMLRRELYDAGLKNGDVEVNVDLGIPSGGEK